MKIELTTKHLVKRNKVICKILKPIAEKQLFVVPVSTTVEYVVSVKDSYSVITNPYTDRRFKTFIPNLLATYYERWYKKFLENEEIFYLDRAYLHFYLVDQKLKQEKEFCLLHCDPNEPDDAHHAKYKKSLHLHIQCSDSSWPHCDIWPHAHIALNTGYLDYVLKDISSLTKAIEEAVVMLKEEVLDSFPRS